MKLLSQFLLLMAMPNIACAKMANDVVVYSSKVPTIVFALLFISCLYYSRTWFRLKIRDGWQWDNQAGRALLVSVLSSCILYHYWPEYLFPHVAAHWWIFLSATANAISKWAITKLLLQLRFRDPYEMKRLRRSTPKYKKEFSVLNAIILCGALFSLPRLSSLQDTLLLFVVAVRLLGMEWRYINKYSSKISFIYMCSVVALGLSLPLHIQAISNSISLAVLALALVRLRVQILAQREAGTIVENCRKAIHKREKGLIRLQELCILLQDEWAMARVTLVTVAENEAILLASAGPKALSLNNTAPQKLGPLLRRVYREAHPIYSPISGELGGENMFRRLRHSSFAIPIFQNNKVVAAICLMAEGEELIDRQDALVMEIVSKLLAEEILSAISIATLEIREKQIRAIVYNFNALLLEENQGVQDRFVIRAETLCCQNILPTLEARYRQEIWNAWASLRTVFGFLPMERNDGNFWAISPSHLSNPALQSMGIEMASLLLADLMQRQSELIAKDEGFRALNVRSAKILIGSGQIHAVSPKLLPSFFTEMDAIARSPMIQHGTLYSVGSPLDTLVSFCSRIKPVALPKHPDIYALMDISADKKEVRRLESQAQMIAKEFKGAA